MEKILKSNREYKRCFKNVYGMLYVSQVQCGFPSPAEDYIETPLDLNEHLISKPAATFFVKAKGDSMIGVGIFDGDLLIIDRSKSASNNQVVPPKKQIVSSRSFGRPVLDKNELEEAIANHISTACEKLRKQKCITKSILIFVQTNPFKNTPQYYNSATMNLLSGSSAMNRLISYSFKCLDQIFRPGYEYKLKWRVIFFSRNSLSGSIQGCWS